MDPPDVPVVEWGRHGTKPTAKANGKEWMDACSSIEKEYGGARNGSERGKTMK